MTAAERTAGTIFIGSSQAECFFERLEGERAFIRTQLDIQPGAFARVSVFASEASVDFDALVRNVEAGNGEGSLLELQLHELSDSSRAVLESVTLRQTGQGHAAVAAQQPGSTGPNPAYQPGSTGPHPAQASRASGPIKPSLTGPAFPAVEQQRRKRTTSAPPEAFAAPPQKAPEMGGTGASAAPQRRARTTSSPAATPRRQRRNTASPKRSSSPKVTFDKPPVLAVCLGRRLAQLHRIEHEVTHIGRGEECQLRIDNPTVSREHCRIERTAGRYWLVDSGASNRTLINGKPAFREELAPGDEIQVAKYVVLFAPSKKQLPEHRVGATVGAARSRPDATDERTYMLEQSQYKDMLDELKSERGAHLKRLEEREVGDPIKLDKKRVIVGRGLDADVRLEGWWRIRKEHAAIVAVDDGITELRHTIERIKGGKPIWINEESYEGRKLLANEDVIEIGNNRFRYYASVRRRQKD
ncbi:MAG: FHA domain-containing protein [Myxococcales bacterium]|nr:FHA domain-containing protein [Myxococcales bacterium]